MGNESMGHAAKMGIGSANPVTQALDFKSENIALVQSIIERDGMWGSRSHRSEDTRLGVRDVSGPLMLEPTPEELAILFPYILGATASGTTFALAETLPEFYLTIDRVAKVFTYSGLVVAKAVFSGKPNGMITLALDLVGTDETVGNAGTFPSLTFSPTTPYVFHDCVFTLAGSAREVSEFSLTIDNAVNTGRFNNSLTRTGKPSEDRVITLQCTVPYSTANAALHAQALAGETGSLVITNGAYSTNFTFATLQCPRRSPTVGGKGEIPLVLDMVARQVGTTKELVVTHDSTP